MIMISAGCKWAGPLAICCFIEKSLNQKKQIFLGEKAFFFKLEMEISTFQDAGHNLNVPHDIAYSKLALIMNWIDLLEA